MISKLLTFLLLSQIGLSELSQKRFFQDSQVVSSDVLDFDFDEYINFSKAVYPITTSSNFGAAYSLNVPFETISMQQGDLNYAEKLSDNLVALVHNDSKIVF